MGPVTVTTSDASGGALHSAPIRVDWRTAPVNVGIGCVVSGTVSYNVEHSFENPPVNWFQNANVSSATANADTNYMFPVEYVRLTQNSGTGSVTLTYLQSGPVR